MNINKFVIDALKPIDIPVAFETYIGSESTYITFSEYLEQGESYFDDEEQATGHYVQVNVFSKGNYSKIVSKVKELLKEVGFIRKTEHGLYEPDTQIYHRVLRFFFIEENEEGK
ncbi:hypothetical protein ACP49_16200 [Clostridium botulinum]|uniref:hypothetical protein n=1 Tax=Clostridium botulinum TaxID=1491 RepID=UPI00015920E6|nr:hypothetical protein [Clostridium botulinum]ABS32781.1 conserved hypothetical protein [Clostridium botulinum A str. ATCC 19397]KIN79898.1 hypothetical protein SD74_18295 [Clostridium botulinum]KOM97074.1 hypothetical protein ACP53_11375 [Clostridium botulinum]KOM99491.1 hypothetical protein ACP49_16200 [Clostridium botulinum]MBO3439673.1 hypothetical protein [Clostridium botulinum]